MLFLPDKLLRVLYSRLSEGMGWVTVDELSQATRSQRSQVFGAIGELTSRGFQIKHNPSKGYCLCRPMPLDRNLILDDLQTQRIAASALCFDEVGSTNDVAMDAACMNRTDGLVVTAESQSNGRGTHGRQWNARPHSAILASCVLIDSTERINREPLTIAAGLGVAQGIEDACGITTAIKWPNDVYINDSKVAGILLETKTIDPQTTAIVIGMGINVCDNPPADQTRKPATCISKHSNQTDRIVILKSILKKLEYWVGAVFENDFDGLRTQWKRRCWMLNERITVNCASEIFTGRVVDIEPLEGLILADDDGRHVAMKAEFSTIV